MRTLPSKTLIHNRYLVGQLVGRGGMGAVYKALDQHLNINVALKHTLGGNEQINRSFSREARILASLRHPALPRITDYFTEDGGLFLVMEFVPGRDLGATLRQRKEPFSVEDVLGWADQLLRVLEYLHGRKPPVLHRDIKPQNIKISAENELFLLDFGLAKGAPVSGSRATRSSIHGFTPQYAPIEQIRARGTSPRSDLYATGATIYQLLTGVPPPSAIERAEQILARQIDPLVLAHQLNPAIPPALSSVLARAIALAADDRPADAAELRAMFADARLGHAPPPPESRIPLPTLVLPATTPGETPLVLPDPPAITPPPTTDPPRPVEEQATPEPQHTQQPVVLDTPTPPTDPSAPATALPAELAPTQMQRTRRASGRGLALVATLFVSTLAGLLLWGRLAQPAAAPPTNTIPPATRLPTVAGGVTPTIRISTEFTAVPEQALSTTLPAPSATPRPAPVRSAAPIPAAAPDSPRLPSAIATAVLPGLAAPETLTPTSPPAPLPTSEPEPPEPTSPRGDGDQPEEPEPPSATPLPPPTATPRRIEAPEPPPAYPAPTARSTTVPPAEPTDVPTSVPTHEATTGPTDAPVSEPTGEATTGPTDAPVSEPTNEPPGDEPPGDEPPGDEPPGDEPSVPYP